MQEGTEGYRERFDRVIAGTLLQAVRIVASSPALFIPGSVILNNQRKAADLRKMYEEKGLMVPPVMIVSITSRCNLSCAGCYMLGREAEGLTEMGAALLASVADQAAQLGVSVIVIAGGEPFMRWEEIFSIAGSHPEVLFPVFTNGLLIDNRMADGIAGRRNIVPVISFEGSRGDTDARRGAGVYDRLLETCARFNDRNIFFGCSITTTRENFDRATSGEFIRQMIGTGVRAFTFVEYVPMAPGTEDLILTPGQKTKLKTVLSAFNREFPALFIGFPGDEEAYGGCLAAGRGFIHVSPSGDLEPCPAAPLSDTNLAAVRLEEALRSLLLARIRDEHGVLTETAGGCALRANREWVRDLIER